jgi:hypothetical protein
VEAEIQIFNDCQPWDTWTDGTDATLRWGRGGTEFGALKVNFFADMVVPLDLQGFLETGKRVERSFGDFDFPLLQNKGRVLLVLELVFLSTHVTPKTSSRFLISLDINKSYFLSWSLNFTRSLIIRNEFLNNSWVIVNCFDEKCSKNKRENTQWKEP